MIPVRQSTAFETSIGPVLDADGVAFTGAIVGDFQVKKTTGDWAALNGSATATHTAVGNYDLVLTTSDLDTVGVAAIRISDTVNACATIYLQVMEEAAYDAVYAASAPGYVANQPVDVNTIKTQTVTCAAGVTVLASVGTAATSTAQTGDTYALANGATGFTAIDTVVDAILALFTGITSVAEWLGLFAGKQSGNATARTEIRATGAGSGTYNETTDSLEAIKDAGAGVYAMGDDYGGNGFIVSRVEGFSQPEVNIGSTGNTATTIHIPSYTYGDDEINNMLLVVRDVSEAEYHSRWVDDWVVSTKLATVATLPFTLENATDNVYLFPIRRDDLALSSAGVTAVQSGLATDAELAKVPKSDSNVTWNATALASINTQSDLALSDYDGPTNAEMEARTLVAAAYFDPAADAVANVTLVATTTNLTNLPSIPNDWITAAGIANGAIDAATFAADVDAEARSWVGLATANLDTQLADLPTVAEFEARTLVAAAYFDPAADTVANVTLVATTTNLTNLPSIPANWLTAAGTAADFTTEIQVGLATSAELDKVPKSDSTVTFNATALASIADGILGRNVAGGSSTGRLVKEALYKLRNRWDIYDNGGTPTMRVYAVDDTTVVWEEALTTDVSTSDVVTGANPT